MAKDANINLSFIDAWNSSHVRDVSMGWQEPEEKKAERVLTWGSPIFRRMTPLMRWAASQKCFNFWKQIYSAEIS